MQLILNIKDNAKALRFISFLETLDYVGVEKVEEDNEIEIHQWQKQILDDRLNNRDTTKYLSEKDLMSRIRSKYGI
jgi:hypothetical protein